MNTNSNTKYVCELSLSADEIEQGLADGTLQRFRMDANGVTWYIAHRFKMDDNEQSARSPGTHKFRLLSSVVDWWRGDDA